MRRLTGAAEDRRNKVDITLNLKLEGARAITDKDLDAAVGRDIETIRTALEE